jgi:hypothetical protein
MNVIQALWFNVTCNCKLMRAVKEENSPNYNFDHSRYPANIFAE